MAASASSQICRGKHDVFISFRGSDIRHGFLSHWTKELKQTGIDLYVDEMLKRGDEISSALVEAIEGSLISLVIFSKDYASSRWCLEELVKITDCKKVNGQIVIPIFYNVDPSHVRHQNDTYGDAFAEHEEKFKDNMDKLQIWRSTLTEVANLSGFHSSNFQNESELINAIVKDVLKKLGDEDPMERKCLVGFVQNFANVESLMEIESREVRVLGIWGPGGIGKTTLARAIFDKFFSKFKSYCFLENVREESKNSNGLGNLRQKLLCELSDQENLSMNEVLKARSMMRRLRRKRVLIVLDDVDTSEQLKKLAGEQLYLGPGSRVIVTSRDKHVLTSGRIHDEHIHEVRQLNEQESIKLFSLNAFNQSHPKTGFEQLSEKTATYAGGIPLALEVLGLHFHSKGKAYWESELNKLQKYRHQQIQNTLKISYDGLDPVDKKIFLDTAFFFVGEHKGVVTRVLDACDLYAVSGIENLVNKALIKVSLDGRIEMHDLIREMGEQIVRDESVKHPERCSRLRDVEEICDILINNMETDEIEGIILNGNQIKDLQLNADTFTKMKKLRIFIFHSPWVKSIDLPFGLGPFSSKLRYFHWDAYPLKSLPLGFCAEKLVELHMKFSNVKMLWDGVQDLPNLNGISLSWSVQLMELPDFSLARKLKIILLNGCRSLHSIHRSILSLHTLVNLDLSFCSKLESLESKTPLESLSNFRFDYCYSLKKFCLPVGMKTLCLLQSKIEILHLPIGHFTELRQLCLNGSRLRSLPIIELGCLTSLEEFRLTDFKQVIDKKDLQTLLEAWRRLKVLDLRGCNKLSEIPDNINSLTRLECLMLGGTSVEILPACIQHLSNLKWIHLRKCGRLRSILGIPPALKYLDASECTSLEILSYSLIQFDGSCYSEFENCKKLDEHSPHIILERLHVNSLSYALKMRPGSRLYWKRERDDIDIDVEGGLPPTKK